jgi:hypothetical protein
MSALNHTSADIVSRILIELNLGAEPATPPPEWPVYVDDEPNPAPGYVPDEIIIVTDTTGTNDGRSMPDGERQEHHGISVRIRARRPDTGGELAERICAALNEQVLRRVVTIDAHVYLVQCFSGVRKIHDYKKDKSSQLRYYSVNGLVSVTKTSA